MLLSHFAIFHAANTEKLEVVELGLFRHCPEALMAMRQVWNEKGLQFYKLWIIKRSFVVDKA